MDIGTLTLDFGLGFGAHAQVTDVARLGFENKEVWRLGASGRVAGLWKEKRKAWALGPLGENYLDIKEALCFGVDHWNDLTHHGNFPTTARVFTQQRFWLSDSGQVTSYRDRQAWDIGYSLHLGLIGISHDFRPLEFLDLLLGFFWVDIADDDMFFIQEQDS
jgi:hypothetical protein